MATRGTFDETTLPFGRDMGTSYDQLSPGDEHALTINLLLNNFYSPPTMADKGIWYLFEGPDMMPL